MNSLEATLSQTAASISFDAKSEFGRFAEGTQGANGGATDTAMAALLGMWATIFQQQVLPAPVAIEAGSAWQEAGNFALAETQSTAASGQVEDTSRDGKSSPILATNILGLAGGQAIQASILWQPAPVLAEASLPVREGAAPARAQASVLPVLPFLSPLPPPVPKEAVVEEAPVLEAPEPVLPATVPAPLPTRADAPVMAAVAAAVDTVPLPQKSKGLDSSPERVEGEKTIPVDFAPVPVASRVVPVVEAPPLETVVNLKRKVSERILAKTPAVEVRPTVNEQDANFVAVPIAEPSKPESNPKADPMPELATKSALPDAAVETEAAVDEEPKLVPEQSNLEAAPRQAAPAVKTAVEDAVQGPAPHSLEPAPRAANSAALPQAPPTAPAVKSSKASFVPEPPPVPPASREAKTISIRIPLNDSSSAMGAPVRHLNLIFHHRNNDLTLQFNSPNTEIQGRIEESMPSLLNKLQTENWTAAPAELTANVAHADPGFDGRRRAESFLPAANQFDSLREPIAPAETASQGFNFDDSQADRKEAQDQSQQGRNRKKDRAWQNEFDEQLEP